MQGLFACLLSVDFFRSMQGCLLVFRLVFEKNRFGPTVLWSRFDSFLLLFKRGALGAHRCLSRSCRSDRAPEFCHFSSFSSPLPLLIFVLGQAASLWALFQPLYKWADASIQLLPSALKDQKQIMRSQLPLLIRSYRRAWPVRVRWLF